MNKLQLIRFKRTLRGCRQNAEIIRAHKYAKSLIEKDMTSFWKDINCRVPLTTMIIFNMLRVTFYNAYRYVLNLPCRCSVSAIYDNLGIHNLEAVIRKSTYFIKRLAKSTSFLVMAIEKSWMTRIDV